MTTTLTLRWEDFEAAFIIGSPNARYFVSLTTGEVVYTSHMDGEKVRARVLKQTAQPGWLELPRPDMDDARREVEAFADTVEDKELGVRIREALGASVPFLAFNRALGSDKDARRGWAAFRDQNIAARLLAFCKEHDLAIDDDRFRALLTP